MNRQRGKARLAIICPLQFRWRRAVAVAAYAPQLLDGCRVLIGSTWRHVVPLHCAVAQVPGTMNLELVCCTRSLLCPRVAALSSPARVPLRGRPAPVRADGAATNGAARHRGAAQAGYVCRCKNGVCEGCRSGVREGLKELALLDVWGMHHEH